MKTLLTSLWPWEIIVKGPDTWTVDPNGVPSMIFVLSFDGFLYFSVLHHPFLFFYVLFSWDQNVSRVST